MDDVSATCERVGLTRCVSDVAGGEDAHAQDDLAPPVEVDSEDII
jgi:hypothetical protein